MSFVDTNIFIRFFTNDHPVRSPPCRKLFESAEQGRVQLQTTESVVTEIAYVLGSPKLYHLPRRVISNQISQLLKSAKISLPHKRTILKALALYSLYPIDLEDALLIAHMLRTKNREVFSYDTGFAKVKGITRLEP